MVTIKVSITDLKSAISKAQAKAANAENKNTDNRILDSQIRGANARVKDAESAVTRSEMTKQEAQDKLSPPPTKQVTSDGKKGGTKTVVDEREKDKLQAQVRAADTQIQQAQSAVEDSRAEAEKLTSQALDGAGVSGQQQQAMGELSDLVSQLKATAENATEDELTGDDFQTKLKSAVDQSAKLAEELPNKGNEALISFWKEIQEGFESIKEDFTTGTTPDAYEIPTNDDDNNYAQFFQDFNTGMAKLITRLEPGGTDEDALADPSGTIVTRITKARDSIMDKSGKFLQGLNENDTKKLTELMDQINIMNNNLDKDREVPSTDFSKLIASTNGFSNILENGGGNFNLILNTQFNTLDSSAGRIQNNIPANQRFTDLMTTLGGINNPNQYNGLLATDFEAIKGIQEQFADASTAIRNQGGFSTDGTGFSEQDFTELMDQTEALATRLTEDYNLNPPPVVTNSGSGTTPNGPPVNSRRRGEAASRVGSVGTR
ncbi:MAG: hypothetical protein O3C63_00145 [Cyanobacteria bacterium]|nr:hypothetical protein [Cyanobacteriota bacterium]